MKRLHKKLHSQSGASILLALLMFLICVMAAASVLAAAASNAGKAMSNRAEQQKYLTLSSALQLVCDELTAAEYQGKYRLYEWDVETTTVETIDPDPDNPIKITTVTTESFFYCEQSEGTYSKGDLNAIPLLQEGLEEELDEIFSRQFTDRGTGYKALDPINLQPSTMRTLTVTLDTDSLDEYGYPKPGSVPADYEVANVVTVEMVLNHETRHITLTAWLGTGAKPPAASTMIAELVAVEGTAPVLDYEPAGRKTLPVGEPMPSPGEKPMEIIDDKEVTVEVTYTTGDGSTILYTEKIAGEPGHTPMKWKLNWIKKGEG